LRFPIIRPFDWTQGGLRSGRPLPLLGIFLDGQAPTEYNIYQTNRIGIVNGMQHKVYRLSHVKEGAGPHKHKIPEIPPITSCLCGRESIMQNKPNSRSAKTNATSCARCHSDRRHATSVPKRRNLLQCYRHLPNRLFSRIYQRIMACILQNKPNVKIGKIAISAAILKAYVNEQRTMSNEHDSKQTQSKPISNAQTAYSAYQTRDCRVASLLAMTRCMSYSGWNDATLRGAGSMGSKGMCEDDFDSGSD